jgi:phosphonate degradation associated HDIG domain protein
VQGRSGGGTQPPELCWDHDGVEVLRGVLGAELLEELRAFLGDLEADAAGRGEIALHHHEQTDSGPALARSERFADTHGGLGRFVLGQAADMVAEVAGEEVVLFKEKVNYKQPGGAGFAPHQDARAYRFTDYHVSLMVPLDPATLESGCLWFAPNPGRGLLADDGRGRIAEWLAETLEWQPVEVQPGDVVVFDSRAPHRSGTNRSTRPRRAMYLTYNRAAEGDLRQRYYRDKEAEFATADGTFGGQRARISISDDFLGRPLEYPGVAVPSGGEASPGDPSSPGGGAAEVLAGMYASPRAQELYDEHVTELAHGLQAAALAEAEGAPADLVAAALLHDVGHLLVGDLVPIDEELVGDARHEAAGARFLRRWFPASVTAPVALHVAAKRYLCAVEPGYAAALSPSSVRSMGVQGGPMSPAEVSDFEARPHHEAAVAMRRWDDLAKVEGLEVPGFDHYVGLLLRLATSGP